jgi:hypothetical protein
MRLRNRKAAWLLWHRLFFPGKGILLLAGLLLAASGCGTKSERVDVCFDHLDHLTEQIRLGSDSVAIVHIYSEFPDYGWVDAAEEGIACVDDVARAAVLYLRHYQIFRDPASLEKARSYLRFVLFMQRSDGSFYNFLLGNGQINRTGPTSRASFGWWAVRAYEAIALGFRVFASRDSLFANRLKEAFMRCRNPLARILSRKGEWKEWQGRRYPAWLVNETAADASAVMLQALTLFLLQQPDDWLKGAASSLAEGIRAMQLGPKSRYPGAFLSYRGIWHAWGNSQAYALAQFARLSGDSLALRAAEREVRSFLPVLLLENWFAEYRIAEDRVIRYPQIAYGVRCAALGALAVFRATGKVKYARLAGLLASWLTGNNPARHPMYDPSTGRGFDGINSPDDINRNAGAESTIEALRTLLEIQAISEARVFLNARFLDPAGERAAGEWNARQVRKIRVPGHGRWKLVYIPEKEDFQIVREK